MTAVIAVSVQRKPVIASSTGAEWTSTDGRIIPAASQRRSAGKPDKISSMSRAESFHLHAPDARSPLKREALLIILSAQGFEDRGSKMKTLEERFWSKVDKSGDCWVWIGGTVSYGYGCFHIGTKLYPAHRVSWAIKNGPIPDGLCILHRCDNPPCVNPDHLFLGTKSDNMKDCFSKGRTFMPVGELCGNSKLKESDVVEILKLLQSGMKHTDIAKLKNISDKTVQSINVGRTWKYLTAKPIASLGGGIKHESR